MSFRVELAYRSEQDVDNILEYLLARSPQGAATWLARWDEVLVELTESADQHSLAPENDDHAEEIRHVIFRTRRGKKYRAIFAIREDCVFVTHVRGPGQNQLGSFESPNG